VTSLLKKIIKLLMMGVLENRYGKRDKMDIGVENEKYPERLFSSCVQNNGPASTIVTKQSIIWYYTKK
jgi:hypothetical protein